jgi:HlyD family secretion protein
MVMKRKIPILLLIVVVAGVGYYSYVHSHSAAKADENVLRVSGNIETHESVVGFKVSGRIAELPVEEGQWVEKNALLARLDQDDYRQQVAMDRAALGVQKKQLQLGLAGSRKQEIEAAEQVLNDARADLQQKKLDFTRAETLYREQVGSEQARDQAETSLKRAQATADRAQQQYDQTLEGTRREQLDVNRAAIVQAEQKLKMSNIDLDYTMLRAPKSGVVLVRQAEVGEVVAPNTPVVTLGDLDHVWVRAYISETDLGRIRWGQPAVIRTDTYPGKSYQGRISFISDKAEFTPKSVQTLKERVTLVYRIKMDVDNTNHELKPGMPVDAEIQPSAATQPPQQ